MKMYSQDNGQSRQPCKRRIVEPPGEGSKSEHENLCRVECHFNFFSPPVAVAMPIYLQLKGTKVRYHPSRNIK